MSGAPSDPHVPVHPFRFVTATRLRDGHDTTTQEPRRRLTWARRPEPIHLRRNRIADTTVRAASEEGVTDERCRPRPELGRLQQDGVDPARPRDEPHAPAADDGAEAFPDVRTVLVPRRGPTRSGPSRVTARVHLQRRLRSR